MATLSTPLSTRDSFLSLAARWFSALAALFIVIASCAGIALGVFELTFANAVYPGVTVYGINLSGLSRDQAVELLSRNFTYPQTGVFVFRDGDQSWTAAPAQLGARERKESRVDKGVERVAIFVTAHALWGSDFLGLIRHQPLSNPNLSLLASA